MAKKEDNKVIEKIIVERKYTNEITPIQAILPIVMEEIERKRKKYTRKKRKKKKNKNKEKVHKTLNSRRNGRKIRRTS